MAGEAGADRLGERPASVFVHYSRVDRDFVRCRLAHALEDRKCRSWIDSESIAPSAQGLAEVYSGVVGADASVFVLSPASVNSEVCLRELAHAVRGMPRWRRPGLSIPYDTILLNETASPTELPDAGVYGQPVRQDNTPCRIERLPPNSQSPSLGDSLTAKGPSTHKRSVTRR